MLDGLVNLETVHLRATQTRRERSNQCHMRWFTQANEQDGSKQYLERSKHVLIGHRDAGVTVEASLRDDR